MTTIKKPRYSFLKAEYFGDDDGWMDYGDIYCACGHVTRNVELDLFTGVEASVEENQYACEKCGNDNLKLLNMHNFNHFPNSIEVYENGDKISLDMKIGTYFWHNDLEKIMYKDSSYRITFNVCTGNFYLLQGRKVRNITYGQLPLDFEKLYMSIRFYYREKFQVFLEKCLAARNVKYVDIHKKKKIGYYAFDFFDFTVYCKYPQLQNMEDMCFKWIPKKFRKGLQFAKTRTEINKVFFGTNAKKVFAEVAKEQTAWERSNTYNTIQVLSEVFEYPENIVKLLQCKRYNEVVSILDDWGVPPGNKPVEHALRLRISNSEDFFPKYEYDTEDAENPRYIEALRFFAKQYTETVLVNRIIKEISITDEPLYSFYNQNSMYQVLLDTYEMYKKIIRKEPNYRVRWKKWSFKRIHDTLSKDLERYADENEAIAYTEQEQTFNHSFDNTFEIRLAEDTQTMITNGTLMNICVGGYTERAIKKKCYYAFLYENGKVLACMSIRRQGANLILEEAKVAHNEYPQGVHAHLIKDWCETHKFRWKSCSDLAAAKYALECAV